MADRQENACLKNSGQNPDHDDDGIGSLVVKALSRLAAMGVRIITRSGGMLALIGDWKGADAVLTADAAALISEPGAAMMEPVAAAAGGAARRIMEELPILSGQVDPQMLSLN